MAESNDEPDRKLTLPAVTNVNEADTLEIKESMMLDAKKTLIILRKIQFTLPSPLCITLETK
jgi:hypothetical protein